MKQRKLGHIHRAVLGLGMGLAIPFTSYAATEPFMTCALPARDATSPVMGEDYRQCLERLRGSGDITGIEVVGGASLQASPAALRRSIDKATEVSSRLAVEFPTAIVNSVVPEGGSGEGITVRAYASRLTTASPAPGKGSLEGAASVNMGTPSVEAPAHAGRTPPLRTTGQTSDDATSTAPTSGTKEKGVIYDPLADESSLDDASGLGRPRFDLVDDYVYEDPFLQGEGANEYAITVNIDDSPV